ncbi:MAG: riboflavin kinase [Actinobacteria bacterium]|nr:riboflavin kinase [Actinomycetota bacterium]
MYGCPATVWFHQRLRAEQRFDGPQALVEQIGRDIAAARQWFDGAGR